MKAFLSTLVFYLIAATALAQLAPAPGAGAADPAAANNNRPPKPPALAGGAAAPTANSMFAAIDADSDGVISARELRKAAAQLKKLDTDKDGTLTLAEVGSQGGAAGPAAAFGDVAQMVDRIMLNDLNGDGILTPNELPPQVVQQMQQMLQGADRDGDGALSKQELTAAMQGMRGPQNGLAGQQGGPNQFQGGQDAAGGEQRKLMGSITQQFDRNGDGQLGSDEVPQQQRGLFRGGDLNNDGIIDPAELRLVIERNGDRLRAMQARDGQDRGRPNAAKDEKNAGDGKEGKE